ncbi:MAG TPA: hypothetical protein VK034_26865 [Enhygromyxa sp.]|nr:hypothetical protein [Enhygromyxa sp.]
MIEELPQLITSTCMGLACSTSVRLGCVMRSTSIVTFVLILGACSARSVTSDDQSSSTTTDDEGDGDATTETDSADLPSTSGDGDGDPLADPCGCEDGQLCVGDCIWGDFNPTRSRTIAASTPRSATKTAGTAPRRPPLLSPEPTAATPPACAETGA